MATLNKAQIIGYIGQDPDILKTANGTAVATISVATSEIWRDKQTGEKKERTEWHRCVLWDKLAEIASKYLAKGSLVYIEGEIQSRKWQDKDGNDKYTTEIMARELKMLDRKSSEGGNKSTASEYAIASGRSPEVRAQKQQTNDEAALYDDDIPF